MSKVGTVALLSLSFLPWSSLQTIPGTFEPELNCNYTVPCTFPNSACTNNTCQCLPGYEFDQGKEPLRLKPACKPCPGAHETCDTCCFPSNTTKCYNTVCMCLDNNDSYACSILFQRNQFQLATEVALGSALVMAIITLMALVWRTCLKRHHLPEAPRERNSSATSLSSVQLLVAQRMRDRPPGYNDRRHIRLEKPPPYEEAVRQVTTLHAVQETANEDREGEQRPPRGDGGREGEGAVGGVDNPGFETTEETGRGFDNGRDKNGPCLELPELHM